MIRGSVAILILIIVAPAGQPRVQRFASPSQQLVVRAVGVGKPGFEDQESRIEVRTRAGRLLAVRDFRSADGEHGFGILHGEWTRDGRWFVFNVESSGGHQPWHRPTYAFDRRSGRYYAIDDYVGPVTSDFTLVGRGSVRTTRMNRETGVQDEPVILHLSRIVELTRSRRGRPNA